MHDLGSVSDLASLVVAMSALFFSVASFRAQQRRAEIHSRAAVRPILSIKSQRYIDLKSIQLLNNGIGPAIIRKAEFWRDESDKLSNQLVSLFSLDIVWESFVNIPKGRAIPAQDKVVLVKESLTHLQGQGYSQEQGLGILENWQRQKSGIRVRIEYEDIFGNEQPALEETLN
ncbi:MAG: hypothetical protein KBB83_08605 [Alphaproteobacteria bacterium]|nr:hypothetical protein [Alphaproteobacteria bacterium]